MLNGDHNHQCSLRIWNESHILHGPPLAEVNQYVQKIVSFEPTLVLLIKVCHPQQLVNSGTLQGIHNCLLYLIYIFGFAWSHDKTSFARGGVFSLVNKNWPGRQNHFWSIGFAIIRRTDLPMVCKQILHDRPCGYYTKALVHMAHVFRSNLKKHKLHNTCPDV